MSIGSHFLMNITKDQKLIFSNAYLFQEYVLQPKQDLYGLGYDPYKHAPEFRGIGISGD